MLIFLGLIILVPSSILALRPSTRYTSRVIFTRISLLLRVPGK